MKKDIHRPKRQEDRNIKTVFSIILLIAVLAGGVFALEPGQILVIANSDINESLQLARYYCDKRAVPAENILKIPLGRNLAEKMSRQDYNDILAAVIRKEITQNRQPGQIRCLLTLYGVPIKVGPAGPLKDSQQLVDRLTPILNSKEKEFESLSQELKHLGRKDLTDQNAARPESFEDTVNHLAGEIKKAVKRIDYVEQADARKQQYDRLAAIMKVFYGPVYAQQQADQLPQISFKLSSVEESELRKTGRILQTSQQDNWSIEKKLEMNPVRDNESNRSDPNQLGQYQKQAVSNGMNFYSAEESYNGLSVAISNIKDDIGRCKGTETSASVDNELSMVLCGDYDLYRWQKNELQNMPLWLPTRTLMVSRLDGPSAAIAAGLIDKAIKAEEKGLVGKAYIDMRGLNIAGEPEPYSLEFFDKSLYLLADMLRNRTSMKVVVENTPALFAPGSCPQTAIYCGWYSVKKYIDAFDFVPGAVGYHIASFEAMDLRNPSSSNWCPAMLSHGITATLGPVDEPYLGSFPLPNEFFAELLDGQCLVEAFYRTNPYNSWQLVLIGDPLYKLNIK